MSGDRLTHEQRQGQVITKLKKGIVKRDLIIKELRNEVKELRSKLEDVSYQFEQLKTIIFKKKGVIKRTLDDDNEKPPKVTRTKESYTRVIPQEGEITAIITHTRDDISYSKTRERIYYIEDIPLDTKKTVEKHIVTEYLCSGTWIPASVLPSKKVILGDTIRMMIITLHTEQRLSYSQIVSLLQLLYQLTISEGEIANILSSEAEKLELTSKVILESIQSEEYHHIDETGWNVKGERNYAWSITGQSGKSYYQLGVSRGKGVAEFLRGVSSGILISDDYGAYKNLAIHHQLCFAHLIRKLRDLAEHPDFKQRVHNHLTKQYQTCKELIAELKEVLQTSDPINQLHYFTEKLTQLAQLHKLDPPPLKRIKTTLHKNISKYLTCLHFPQIPLTNNTAERSLRHLVIKRRISFGSTSYEGAKNTGILMTVIKDLFRCGVVGYWERLREVRRV